MFENHRMSDATDYMSGRKKFSDLKAPDLYHFAMAANAAMKEEIFDIDNIYTEEQIEKFKEPEKQAGFILPLEIPVLKINDSQYVASLDVSTISNLFGERVIYYNMNTQRQPTVYKVGGEEFVTATINKRSVDEIFKALEAGQYVPDEITLNLINTEDYEFINNESVLVLKEGHVDIIDGYHRLNAIVRFHLAHPDVRINFPVNFVILSKERAIQYIIQRDKRNPINKDYLYSIDTELPINRLLAILEKEPYYRDYMPQTKECVRALARLFDGDIITKHKGRNDISQRMAQLAHEAEELELLTENSPPVYIYAIAWMAKKKAPLLENAFAKLPTDRSVFKNRKMINNILEAEYEDTISTR